MTLHRMMGASEYVLTTFVLLTKLAAKKWTLIFLYNAPLDILTIPLDLKHQNPHSYSFIFCIKWTQNGQRMPQGSLCKSYSITFLVTAP